MEKIFKFIIKYVRLKIMLIMTKFNSNSLILWKMIVSNKFKITKSKMIYWNKLLCQIYKKIIIIKIIMIFQKLIKIN